MHSLRVEIKFRLLHLMGGKTPRFSCEALDEAIFSKEGNCKINFPCKTVIECTNECSELYKIMKPLLVSCIFSQVIENDR